MSQYNKISDIQYARYQILAVNLDFGLFWSGGIPTMRRDYLVGPTSPIKSHNKTKTVQYD